MKFSSTFRQLGLVVCLLCGIPGYALAETPTPQPAPEIQQQLVDARKQVLDAETRLVEEKIRNQRSEHEAFVKNESTLFTYTTVGLIAGVVIGWLSFLLMAQKWVREQVNNEIEGNLKHLTRIVDNSRLEKLIKEKTRLLVLHQAGQHTQLHSELRKTGFLVADAMPCPASPTDIDWKEYDQVVFDNMDENTLLAYVREYPNRMFFAYTAEYYKNLPRDGNVATANSKMTLYSRLIESLTWHYWQNTQTA